MNTALKPSATARISVQAPGELALGGTLNFDTVPALLQQAVGLMASCERVVVNLSAVETANSAALALMLEMLRLCRQRGAAIGFKQVPPQLASVARAYGIASALDAPDFAAQG